MIGRFSPDKEQGISEETGGQRAHSCFDRLSMSEVGFALSSARPELVEGRAESGTRFAGLPRNAGKNRTASKRALLKAIEDIGGKW